MIAHPGCSSDNGLIILHSTIPKITSLSQIHPKGPLSGSDFYIWHLTAVHQNTDTCYKCLIIEHSWVAVGLFTVLWLNQTVAVNSCTYSNIFHSNCRNWRIGANFEIEIISRDLKRSKCEICMCEASLQWQLKLCELELKCSFIIIEEYCMLRFNNQKTKWIHGNLKTFLLFLT